MVKPAAAPLVVVPRRWEPRDYQKPLVRYLEGGGKRADVVAHRRWGQGRRGSALGGGLRGSDAGDLLASAAGGEPGAQGGLEIGYATRGAQVVACDAARALAVQTHAAEHALEDQVSPKRRQPPR